MPDLFGGNFGWNDTSVATVSADCATVGATPKTSDLCGVEVSNPPVVASVASVAPWNDGIERLSARRRPQIIEARAWNQMVSDARMLAQIWGAEFVAHGWSTLDVFGVPSHPRGRRLDVCGLISLLRGRAVDAVDADTATIRNVRGEPNRFYRHLRADGAVPIWEWVR